MAVVAVLNGFVSGSPCISALKRSLQDVTFLRDAQCTDTKRILQLDKSGQRAESTRCLEQ
jgi:hypothetical protein